MSIFLQISRMMMMKINSVFIEVQISGISFVKTSKIMRSKQFIMDIDKANCYQWHEFYVNQNECYVSKKEF